MTANDDRDYDISREALGLTKDEQPKGKDIEPIAKGKTATEEQNGWNKFLKMLFGGEPKDVMMSLLKDTVMPSVQDLLYDSGRGFLDRLIFGESRNDGRRNSTRRDYGSYSRHRGSSSPRRDEPRRARPVHHFDNVVLDTRDEADSVLSRMYEFIDTYKMVTVAELYSLVGITAEYTDEGWGWRDLRTATIRRVREGYLIDLPQPKEL